VANTSEPGEPPNQKRTRQPKRGAFPTPKSEIEAATPFVPDAGEGDEVADKNDDAPTRVDEEKQD
jgi:hypothetical protein